MNAIQIFYETFPVCVGVQPSDYLEHGDNQAKNHQVLNTEPTKLDTKLMGDQYLHNLYQ